MSEPRYTADTITDDALDALYAELAELREELGGRDEEARERWVEKQLAETGLKAMDFRNGMSMEIEPAREMVAHWVGAARGMLGDAPNYSETPIEMVVKVGESPERFAFVLQRVGKLTPHEARQRAEAERDRYRAAWQSARERAQAYGDGILQHVADRETWQRWFKGAEAKLEQALALAADATEYRIPVPENGGTGLLLRRQALAHGTGWAASVMARGGGRAWTTEGWQESISALSVDRLFCWPDAATAASEIRQALSTTEQ